MNFCGVTFFQPFLSFGENQTQQKRVCVQEEVEENCAGGSVYGHQPAQCSLKRVFTGSIDPWVPEPHLGNSMEKSL